VVARGGTVGGLRIDLVVDAGGVLRLIWAENRTGRNQLFETRISANGDSLMAARQITSSPGEALNPRMRVDGEGFVHLMWSDTRTGRTRVYYRATCCSDDRTLVTDTLISDPAVDTKMADMDVDAESRARVVWTTGTGASHGNVFHALVDLIAPRLAVEPPTAAADLAVRVAPNPFLGVARVAFRATTAERISVTVHDVLGRSLASLWNGVAEAGEHVAVWNGRDDRGAGQPAGVYFVRVETPGGRRETRVVKLRCAGGAGLLGRPARPRRCWRGIR
jgi:hypothetical protein